MKKYQICFSMLLLSLIVSFTGCTGYKDVITGILPSRIENIKGRDVIPEGAEGMELPEYDPKAFNPRMFVGEWTLQKSEGTTTSISVPAPLRYGRESLTVEAFPTTMIFYDAIRGNNSNVYRIAFDDYMYLQAEYKAAEQKDDEKDASLKDDSSAGSLAETKVSADSADLGESIEFRMLYAVKSTTLAVGFTGEVTDEEYFTDDVDSVDISEFDYGFQWKGYELTLTYGNASATYVPSTFNGDMKTACGGFSAGNGQTRIPEWKFSPLVMNGDGTGSVGTLYDNNVAMQYSFGEDGSFSIVTEHGEEFSYDSYWYSDSCMTLPAGDLKMMYQHDLLTFSSEDEYRTKNVEVSLFGEELVLSGRKMGGLIWSPVARLIKDGYRTNVDTEKSIIPSGCISPEFEISFRTSHMNIRAVNPTDIDLPLGACIVCAYRFDEDSGSIKRRVRFLIGDDLAACGETTREELLSYSNLHPVNDELYGAEFNVNGYLSDYDFDDYSAHLLDGMEGSSTSEFMFFELKDDRLHSISCYLPLYIDCDLEFNMKYDALSGLSAGECEETAKRRDEIVQGIREDFEGFNGVLCDDYGTLFISWTDLFVYGKAELSDEGRRNIRSIIDKYMTVLKEYEEVTGTEIGAYVRIERDEDGQSLSASRAAAVCDCISSEEGYGKGKNSLNPEFCSAGYGESEYLKGPMGRELNGNYISIRFLMDPVPGNEKVESVQLVDKYTKAEDTYKYMRQDEKAVGRDMASYASKYAGTYRDDCYVNEAIGIKWQLPDGWHFFNDDELTAYNGDSADMLLINALPIYIFAAVDDDYDTMMDIRLYPCEGSGKEEAADEYARNLFQSYDTLCRTKYSNVETEYSEVTPGGKQVRKGTFRFSADEQDFIRKQYYLTGEDAVAVITMSGTEDSAILDDPGL